MAMALVVDDAAFMRVTLKNIFSRAGWQVAEAVNGVEAVARYKELRPDVVTMDITMPEKDGLQATEEIRAFDPNARIVICSALGQESMVRRAVTLGVKDFIVKPFDPQRVLAAVQSALTK